jgi:hypothetical protein
MNSVYFDITMKLPASKTSLISAMLNRRNLHEFRGFAPGEVKLLSILQSSRGTTFTFECVNVAPLLPPGDVHLLDPVDFNQLFDDDQVEPHVVDHSGPTP